MSKIHSRSAEEVLTEDLTNNSEVRTYWENTALARAVALAILRYRTEHNLSQRRMGQLLGVPQSRVSRLEIGEHAPSLELLQRLSTVRGLRFILDAGPASQSPVVTPPGVELIEDVVNADGRIRVGENLSGYSREARQEKVTSAHLLVLQYNLTWQTMI